MKPIHCLFVLIATLLMCGDLHAQQRGFGQGRFLQRLKNDLFGEPAPKPKYQPKANPQARTAPKTPQGRVPTPATRNQNVARPTPTQNKTLNGQNLFKPNSPLAEKNPQRKSNLDPQISGSGKDFGMLIETNKAGDLVVTRVLPSGNAAAAGIRMGDTIVEAGGAEITSPEELKSIIGILKQGDQLEFKIKNRSGRSSEMLVAYGTTPEVDTAATEQVSGETSYGMKSVLDGQKAGSNYQTKPVSNRTGGYAETARQRQIEQLKRQLQQLENQNRYPQRTAGPDVNGPGR